MQFLNAAAELAERDGDPALRRLDVAERTYQRWLRGVRPFPEACRVLEHMLGVPIELLRKPAPEGTAAALNAPRVLRAVPADGEPSRPKENGSPHVTISVTDHGGGLASITITAGSVRVVVDWLSSAANVAADDSAGSTCRPSGPHIYLVADQTNPGGEPADGSVSQQTADSSQPPPRLAKERR